jgi:branched-chain amino acid transport system substrate-binding protein
MLSKKKLVFAIFLISILLVSLPVFAAEKIIKMGVFGPFTGPYVDVGSDIKNGIEMAVRFQNEAGGVQVGKEKYRVELVYGDTESKVEAGLSAIDKLITVDKIDIAVGFLHSHIFLPATDKFQAYGVPVVDASAAALTIPRKIAEKKLDYNFQLSPTTGDHTRGICEAINHYLKPKIIGMLNENTDGGRDYARLTEAWFKKNAPGVKIVYNEFVMPGTTDFTAELAKIKASGAESIIGEVYGASASAFFEQWYDMRVPTMFSAMGSTVNSQDFIDKHRKQMERNLFCHRWWPAPYTDISLSRIEAYIKRFGKDPTNHVMQGHDAALVAMKAIELASSLNKKDIKEALEKGTFVTVWGKRKFSPLSEGHTCSTEMVCVQIQDGKKVPLWPLAIAKGTYRPVPPWPWELK